jgi:two-component system, cell cycle sensor histidine kinase and response regulator CckA
LKKHEESIVADKHRTLLDRAGQAIFVGQDDKLVYFNPATAEIMGYPPEELMARPFLEFIHPDDRTMLVEGYLRLLKGETLSQGHPLRVIRQDGRILWVELQGFQTDWEGRPAVLVFLWDMSEKDQEEEALRASREELRLTLEATTDGIWQWDFRTNEMSFSRRYYTMLGYEPGAFPPSFKAWHDLIHPEDLPHALSCARRYMGTGPDDYENIYRLRTATGQYRWIHSRGRVVERDGEGKAVRMIGRHEDITKLKEAEAELRGNEARLRSLVRILQYPSEQAQEFLDNALNEAVGLTGSKVGYIYFYDDTRKEFTINTWSKEGMKECTVESPPLVYQLGKTGLWGEAVRQRRPILINDFQAPHPLKRGYPRGHIDLHRYLTVPVFRDDRIVAVVGVGNKEVPYTETDTLQLTLLMDTVWKETDRWKARDVLRQRENTYRAFFDSIRDPIMVADPERNIVDCNPAFSGLFGYELDAIKGKKTALVYESKEDYEAMGKALKARIGTEEIVSTVRFKKRSGEVFPGEVQLSYLKARDGRITGVVGQIRDLSERLLAETRRSELEAQLLQAQKLEAVGRLAGGVAHDFNNLLTVILGYGEMALEDLQAGHPHHSLLKGICDAGNRARNLTRQLLAFSRKQVLEMQRLDVNTVVGGFEKLMRRVIGEDVLLKMALREAPVRVTADPSQLEQVLMNLAVNARDAMPEGGVLAIETGIVELDADDLSKKPGIEPGPYAMIAVSDTGVGMDRETLPQIFEPFFTTKESDRGTGLGLATSYGIIKQHGGDITVYSEPGRGTTFKIYLPMDLEEEAAEPRVAERRKPLMGTGTVLVVEDDPMVLRLACDLLRLAGYQVLQAANPAAALKEARSYGKPIDLILSDVILPGLKGPDMVEKVREIHPQARVVYMSGYAQDAISHNGLLEDDDLFLPKPFTAWSLREKVAEALGRP